MLLLPIIITFDNNLLDGINCLFHFCISRSSTVPVLSMNSINILISPITEFHGKDYNVIVKSGALKSEIPGFNK